MVRKAAIFTVFFFLLSDFSTPMAMDPFSVWAIMKSADKALDLAAPEKTVPIPVPEKSSGAGTLDRGLWETVAAPSKKADLLIRDVLLKAEKTVVMATGRKIRPNVAKTLMEIAGKKTGVFVLAPGLSQKFAPEGIITRNSGKIDAEYDFVVIDGKTLVFNVNCEGRDTVLAIMNVPRLAAFYVGEWKDLWRKAEKS